MIRHSLGYENYARLCHTICMGLFKLYKSLSNHRGFRVTKVPDYVGSTDTG